MPRSLVVLAVLLVVIVAGLFFLAGRDTSKEPTRVEKDVRLENLN